MYTEDMIRSIERALPNGQKIVDPLSLNLYVYCANNPILYYDTSGNFFILAALAVGLVAGAAGGALYSIIRYGEVHWKDVAIGTLIGGVAGLTVGVAGALIFGGGIAASTAQVGYGLVAMLASQAPQVIQGVKDLWQRGAALRGQIIEKALGGMGNNFPVIDKFVRGTRHAVDSITSIKSIDIFAKSYHKAGAIYNQLMGYGNSLYNFTSKTWGGIKVIVDKGTMRFLEVAIPQGASSDQLMQIRQATIDLGRKGIQVILHVFK